MCAQQQSTTHLFCIATHTQIKTRPPTFVAFLAGSQEVDANFPQFLSSQLREALGLGGTPLRFWFRCVLTRVWLPAVFRCVSRTAAFFIAQLDTSHEHLHTKTHASVPQVQRCSDPAGPGRHSPVSKAQKQG